MTRKRRMDGWLIVTKSGAPLLYDGRLPMFWRRSVAKTNLQPWMTTNGCKIVRATVVLK